jgi:hypothetical protein
VRKGAEVRTHAGGLVRKRAEVRSHAGGEMWLSEEESRGQITYWWRDVD